MLPANSGSRSVVGERFNGGDIFGAGASGRFRLELNLEIEPELDACIKKLRETLGCVARETHFFARYALNAGAGHEACPGEFASRKVEGLHKLFAEDFAGVQWWQLLVIQRHPASPDKLNAGRARGSGHGAAETNFREAVILKFLQVAPLKSLLIKGSCLDGI